MSGAATVDAEAIRVLHVDDDPAFADIAGEFWNDAVREVTGYDDEAIAEMASTDYFGNEDRQLVAEAIEETLETGQASLTADLVTKEGTRIPYELTGSLLTDADGDSIGFAGVGRDLTDRLKRERELERKNEDLEEFTRMVSHDIRSPLEVAQGHAELARTECDSDHLDELVETHERMADLVDNLLAIAKEKETPEDLETVSLPSVARATWAGVESGDATLRVETDRTLEADEHRLERILTNLFRNSVEHGSTGSRTASGDSVEHGSTGNRPEARDAVEHGVAERDGDSGDGNGGAGDGVTVTVGGLDRGFYVEDDGTGIEPENRDDVFESGYTTADRGSGSASTSSSGSSRPTAGRSK